VAQRDIRTYFVVHRGSAGTQVLAYLDHGTPHRRLLDPFLSQFLHADADGTLMLVDAETRELVLRCPIEQPTAQRGRSRARSHRFWLI